MRVASMPAFECADRIPAQPGALGQLFLREPGSLPKPAQLFSKWSPIAVAHQLALHPAHRDVSTSVLSHCGQTNCPRNCPICVNGSRSLLPPK
jgi:hypothetical protein